MKVPFRGCSVTYTFECTRCSRLEHKQYKIARGDQLPRPTLPPGWFAGETVAGSFLLCELHTVETKIVDRPWATK